MTHAVRPGECLSSIAADHGMTWRQLWDDPRNAGLRALRKDPNVLHPGDQVAIPERTPRPRAPLEPGVVTTVVRRRAGHRPLRLLIRGSDGAPLADAEYRLAVGGAARTGRTDAGGVLREELPLSAQTATLEVGALRFDLRLGHLNPLVGTDDRGLSGAQARLRNLGFPVAAIDGRLDEATTEAVRSFQAAEGLDPSGELDPSTIKRLWARHGC